MTKQEIYDLIYDEPDAYRPMLESQSALLEVTCGCNYAGCAFCATAQEKYFVYDEEDIEKKIRLLAQVIEDNDRIFLLGGSPFCLPTAKLLRIFDMIHKYLPSVEEISMHARAADINRKSWIDVLALKEAGLKDLHVGFESGSDRVLALHNKGETAFDIYRALDTLESCEIGHHLTIILGMGGREYSREHALMTAEALGRVHPDSIWAMPLSIWPGTPLYRMTEKGAFKQMTPIELLREERLIIENTEMKRDCLFIDPLALNKYTLSGRLPSLKDDMIANIDILLQQEK